MPLEKQGYMKENKMIYQHLSSVIPFYNPPYEAFKACLENIHVLDPLEDLEPLKAFAKEHRIPLTIQNVQPKKSYQAHYITEPLPYATFQCSYLENEKMHYYFVDGTKAPCCFMIDATKVLPTTQIQHHLAQKNVPSCCTQCGELTGHKRKLTTKE